jgi:AraC family transcriptional activator FtrA
VLDGLSPLDLGAVAEVFGIDRGLALDWYDFSICGERPGRPDAQGGLHLIVDRGLEQLEAADTVVVLPAARFVHERPSDQVLEALVTAWSRGCRIVSVCLGAFVLAAAGFSTAATPPRTGGSAAPLPLPIPWSRSTPACCTSMTARC